MICAPRAGDISSRDSRISHPCLSVSIRVKRKRPGTPGGSMHVRERERSVGGSRSFRDVGSQGGPWEPTDSRRFQGVFLSVIPGFRIRVYPCPSVSKGSGRVLQGVLTQVGSGWRRETCTWLEAGASGTGVPKEDLGNQRTAEGSRGVFLSVIPGFRIRVYPCPSVSKGSGRVLQGVLTQGGERMSGIFRDGRMVGTIKLVPTLPYSRRH